jgi:putative copper resistance protein D
VWTLLTAPPVALASYAVVIVGSHLTGLMDDIMRNAWAGQVEHLVYLVIGCQFFLLVLGDTPGRWQLSTPARWLMLALSMAVDTFVGIVIMQANRPVAMTAVPGLSVNTLADTHTGGAIMWFGGDGIMAAIMIAMVIGWLNDPARQRRDNSGWLEQARRVTFAERTGDDSAGIADDLDFDDEDGRLAAYNSWLAEINRTT